tara:strand:+ start:381 stop:587 length:207 start_codon:yes stop_codon:yes gene_type:complete
MKQPKNSLRVIKEAGEYWIDVEADDGAMWSAAISRGLSKGVALSQAQRRLKRLLREVDRKIKEKENGI